MKKKVLATLLVGAMAASLLAGCGTTVETTGSSDTTTAPEKTQTTETAEAGEAGGSDVSADITLWTYPIGEWGNAETVDSLIQDFNKEYPGINVTVEYLDYTNGDDQVNTAIEGGQAPDLIMEGPERLVANWIKESTVSALPHSPIGYVHKVMSAETSEPPASPASAVSVV